MPGSRACKTKQYRFGRIGYGRNRVRGEQRECFYLRQAFTFGALGGDRRTDQDALRVVPEQTRGTMRNVYLLRRFEDAITDASQRLLLLVHDAQACPVSSPQGGRRYAECEVVYRPQWSMLL